jgi:murein DD-endopeptidase MepM/ murein hydrolase activator NlpD
MSPRPTYLLLLSLLGCCLCLPHGPASAKVSVYRWVDDKGNVHYADRGTPDAKKIDVRQPPPSPSSLADLEVVRNGDGSDVFVSNRLGGPIEVNVGISEAVNVQSQPALPVTQMLPAKQRVLISHILPAGGQVASFAVGMTAMPGDPTATPADVVYALPVDEDSGWQIGQGFDGRFSHNDEQNRYAVDLIIPEGTPILAARDGVVMQVESGFDGAGLNKEKFAERANVIRVLHDDGSMAIYAHLKENGAYVRLGQRVTVGQQIGVSGNTGFTSGPHLHFCIQVNRGMRLVSVPFRMVSSAGFLPLRK